jgi:hypothetical protein
MVSGLAAELMKATRLVESSKVRITLRYLDD